MLSAKLLVDSDGKVEGCEVDYSQAPKAESAKFCQNLMGLKLARPAIGPDGKPAFGILEISRIATKVDVFDRKLPNAPIYEPPPDLELSVNILPEKNQKRMRLGLTILVDDHGAISACQPPEHSEAGYGRVACEQVKQMTSGVKTNAAGVAVPYVADFVVDFVLDKPAG